MDREEVVHIYSGILLGHKKSKILPSTTTRTDLEGIMLSGICQTEEDEHHMISLACGN